MKLIGLALIILSLVLIIFNLLHFLSVRSHAKTLKLNATDGSQENVAIVFTPMLQFYGGQLALSVGALPIGIAIFVYQTTFLQLVGYALILSSLGGVIQTYRPTETQAVLYKSGDFETTVTSMNWRLRAMADIAFGVGIYLLVD